jgi:2-iminoacetate synthase ThiH
MSRHGEPTLDEQLICPDNVTTAQWVDVIAATRCVGLRTTATIMPPEAMEAPIRSIGRESWQRTTLYKVASPDRVAASLGALPLSAPVDTPVRRALDSAVAGQ